jgi:hypothetical protein
VTTYIKAIKVTVDGPREPRSKLTGQPHQFRGLTLGPRGPFYAGDLDLRRKSASGEYTGNTNNFMLKFSPTSVSSSNSGVGEVANPLNFGHPTDASGWTTYGTPTGGFTTNFSQSAYSDINPGADNGFSTTLLSTTDADYFSPHQASYHHMGPPSPSHHAHHPHHTQYYHSAASYYPSPAAPTYSTSTLMGSPYGGLNSSTTPGLTALGGNSTASSVTAALYSNSALPPTLQPTLVDPAKSDLTITMYAPNSTHHLTNLSSLGSVSALSATSMMDPIRSHLHQHEEDGQQQGDGTSGSDLNSAHGGNSSLAHLSGLVSAAGNGSGGDSSGNGSVTRNSGGAVGTSDSLGVWRPY